MIQTPPRALLGALVALSILVPGLATAGLPPLSSLAYLPGDAVLGPSAERQDWVEIVPGGPGYLMVWEDDRTVLSGFTSTPYLPLMGNETDIYAARLDADGNLLDPKPILVANQGRNQTRPKAAWNGENWLVVWVSERPDWYFFEDVVGVRVSPAGTVLDPVPIPIRPENNDPANDGGQVPSVASDGTDWLVVWQGLVWHNNIAYPSIAGRRVSAGGALLDAADVVLFQYPVAAFGPRNPRAAWAGDEYLVVWNEALGGIEGRRFDTALQPLDAGPFSIGSGENPRIASDGDGFFVVTSELAGHRVNHAGAVLDPLGIDFPVAGSSLSGPGPDVAWDGFNWVAAFGATPSPFDEPDLYVAEIAADGTVIGGGPQPLPVSPASESKAAVASTGDGRSQIAWVEADFDAGRQEDVRTRQITSALLPGPARDGGVGLPRQWNLRFAGGGGQHLAVFVSEVEGATRIVAQRLDPTGQPIDLEPLRLVTYSGFTRVTPDVAFNGTIYLVSWTLADGTVVGQRVSAGLTLIDPAPVPLVTDGAVAAGVGALGDDFLIAYVHRFSGDLQYLKGFRVDAGLTVLDTPFLLGGDFSMRPRVTALGGQWLVVWPARPGHDATPTNVFGEFVTAAGVPGGSFAIDGAGYADTPGVAVGNGRAFIDWSDDVDFPESRIEGRILLADGTFLGPEFVIANPPMDQLFPAAAWDGQQFVAAWVDYRSVTGIEQLRGDIYAARIGADGSVVDPNGFAVTSGPLPEDLPDLAAAGGATIVGFSKLAGVSAPEIQRIGYRVIGAADATIFADSFESGDMSAWSAAVP